MMILPSCPLFSFNDFIFFNTGSIRFIKGISSNENPEWIIEVEIDVIFGDNIGDDDDPIDVVTGGGDNDDEEDPFGIHNTPSNEMKIFLNRRQYKS